jgi:hypothetical protein
LTPAPAVADVVVISSNTRAYRAGQELKDSERLKLGSSDLITVLLPTNAVREVKGPFDGDVSELGRGRPSSGRELWTLITSYFTTGGVDESRVGGTRALSPTATTPPRDATPPAGSEAPWTAIPLGEAGVYCVASDQPPEIVRVSGSPTGAVRLAAKDMTAIAGLAFDGGAASVQWPASIPLADDASYRFIIPGQPSVAFTVKLIEKSGLESPEVLTVLYEKGCTAQIKAWLKSQNAG